MSETTAEKGLDLAGILATALWEAEDRLQQCSYGSKRIWRKFDDELPDQIRRALDLYEQSVPSPDDR